MLKIKSFQINSTVIIINFLKIMNWLKLPVIGFIFFYSSILLYFYILFNALTFFGIETLFFYYYYYYYNYYCAY